MPMSHQLRTAALLASCLVLAAPGIFGQAAPDPTPQAIAAAPPAETRPPASLARASANLDLDAYYSYWISGALYYQQLSAIGSKVLAGFSMNEVSGEVRVPLPGLPWLQPILRGGLVTMTYLDEDDNQDWSHSQVFGAAGVAYVKRLSREVELGGELYLGGAESYFDSLVVSGEPRSFGQFNLLASLGARFALNPSYSLSVSVSPAVRYTCALGELHDFDGFTFGAGFSASYRFGQDPDAAQSAIKAVRFGSTRLPPLFAAMRSYYATMPAGVVTIANGEKYGITDVSVSFMQPGFMDSPTPLATGLSLKPGESVDVPVLATFNDQVFSTEGVTPLTGEIIVEYSARGRRAEQRQSLGYDLYDRNAITWDDDRKIAAFITPQDSALRNYASFIRQAHKDATSAAVSANLQFAMQAFDALAELGIMYQIDPVSPFASMKGDARAVDSVSLPRQTIKRRTGDCDDLTALFCALLETVGIETALITVPGHIYCAFDSGVASADYRTLAPDRAMAIESGGRLWVPVEITMIGVAAFADAWKAGSAEWTELGTDPAKRAFYKVKDAQALYRPVSLRETDLGVQYGDEQSIVARFKKDLAEEVASVLRPFRNAASSLKTASAWNALGIMAARLGENAEARRSFDQAMIADPGYLSAYINLGSLLMLTGKDQDAMAALQKAEKMIEASAPSARDRWMLFINLGKAAYALGRYDDAKAYYGKAAAVDAEASKGFEYLGSPAPAPSP